MELNHLYTQEEVIQLILNLVNGIGLGIKGDIMAKRYKQSVDIDGEKTWITGSTIEDLLKRYLELCLDKGVAMPPIMVQQETKDCPIFGKYIQDFVKIYKSNQQSLTRNNQDGIIKKHILPKWGNYRIDEITTSGIQEWLNSLDGQGYSHETLLKIRNIMSPVLDSAIEDDYIYKNPFKSKRLVIKGSETVHHKAIPHEKMAEIRKQISQIVEPRARMLLALLCYTGMRFEEILGLKWDDIDRDGKWIYIQRAVVHPSRNLPEVKDPKSKSSKRRIPLPDILWNNLWPRYNEGYILYSSNGKTGEKPLSFTEARNSFRKLRESFGLEGYSAHDFRDTCATEWREAGVPIDVISHLLGHSKSDITENRYVKYRDELYRGVREVMEQKADKSPGMRS